MIGPSSMTCAPEGRLHYPPRQIARAPPGYGAPESPSPPMQRGYNRYQRQIPAAAVTTRAPVRAPPSPCSPPGFVLPAYGERGHPVAEQFETTLDKTKTMFFRRRVSIFKVWQLFIMWLAFTGLLVFIASVMGFRQAEKVNGTCDVVTTCQDEAECVGGQCVCRQPPFVVVGGICVYNFTQ
ncbi:hypothetical protein HPB51_019656 [Rhipicephalus microplus]|uniref:Uncharacterized protein n=1 Tax=Rhipicephalus microplus TaxID=6941 RepID=A0A9J6EBF9_RHIMP|nr:hypothetical protein HPB51_019656 [Rhipicephalus microplus]